MDSPARGLYRSLGYEDLARQVLFPSAPRPYAVMGAPLPLRRSGLTAQAYRFPPARAARLTSCHHPYAAGVENHGQAQVQRMSRLMVKTLRDDPADAETLSHKLLVRAGYVRRTAAGIWTWLPLGKKVLDNVARVVREEMDAIGAQEVAAARPAAQGAVRGDRPLGGVRRPAVPPQGPQGRATTSSARPTRRSSPWW